MTWVKTEQRKTGPMNSVGTPCLEFAWRTRGKSDPSRLGQVIGVPLLASPLLPSGWVYRLSYQGRKEKELCPRAVCEEAGQGGGGAGLKDLIPSLGGIWLVPRESCSVPFLLLPWTGSDCV